MLLSKMLPNAATPVPAQAAGSSLVPKFPNGGRHDPFWHQPQTEERSKSSRPPTDLIKQLWGNLDTAPVQGKNEVSFVLHGTRSKYGF